MPSTAAALLVLIFCVGCSLCSSLAARSAGVAAFPSTRSRSSSRPDTQHQFHRLWRPSARTTFPSSSLRVTATSTVVPPFPWQIHPPALSMANSSPLMMESPRTLVNRGMDLFRRGDVDGSIALFDMAEEQAPGLKPYLWQRGLSYYYANRFREGSDQFRYDVSVNPLDVEEIVWDIACQSRLNPDAIPPPNKMSLPAGRRDRREIMATVYSLFRGDGATEHDLAAAGHTGSKSDEFYSLFYLGLYCESRGEMGKAAGYMKAAASSAYGLGSGDYMCSCCRVHCKLRGWV